MFKRWQRLDPARGRRLATKAGCAPGASAAITYPDWYLQRWHFLPEGYLSERSMRWYDSAIRPLYTAGLERAALRAVASALQPLKPRSVLELGCGAGRCVAFLAAALPAASLTGVDLSPYAIATARTRLGERAEVSHADATVLPFGAETFDAVVACHVFGHVPLGVARAMLSEARRVLSPGGRLLVVDHAWHALPAENWRTMANRRLPPGWIRLRTLAPA